MPTYDILSPIRKGGKRITSGTVDLAEKEGGALVELKILALAAKQGKAPAGSVAPPPEPVPSAPAPVEPVPAAPEPAAPAPAPVEPVPPAPEPAAPAPVAAKRTVKPRAAKKRAKKGS